MITMEVVACAVCASTQSVPARVRAPRDDDAVELGLPGGRSRWVVCSQCGLVFQSPRPDSEAVTRLYAEGNYHANRGGVPEHYIRYSLRRSQAALAWALSLPVWEERRTSDRSIGETGRALDIGCGIGGALVTLRDRGWAVAGVEPDPVLAAVGRERFGLDIRPGFFERSTFPDEAFDLAYSCHVWEHLADPEAVARAAHGVLRSTRGCLVIVVPTFRRARTLAWACFTAPHTYMFTEVSLGNVLRRAGFDVVGSRFASAAGDSELWLVARARDDEPATATYDSEDLGAVQRELLTVPLRAPLGLPTRVARHVRTLTGDPADFVRRLGRWVRARARRAWTALGGHKG
jgi:SAM-dependent methyltransferase